MSTPKTTVWQLDAHTRAKHQILHSYLRAWTPILSLGGFPVILYVDGFAGPGKYAGGEDGSPLIALQSALDHKDTIKAKLGFVFIERDPARAKALDEFIQGVDRPANFRVTVKGGMTFEEGFGEVLGAYKSMQKPLPPTFAFIDPFGWTGVPFSLVKEIMSYSNCEILINFMFEEINRFIGHPDQERNFDSLFGTDEWRRMPSASRPIDRRNFLRDLYFRQLHNAANIKYVRSFEMRNDKNATDYFLFFGTNSLKGVAKMKEAMWKVDDSGEFRFSDATNPNQAVLFQKAPNIHALRSEIIKRFGGGVATVGEVEEFVLVQTPFRETHYKKQVLQKLEMANPPLVSAIDPPPTRKIGTYPDLNLRLRFA